MTEKTKAEVVVIGAGPAGYVAAIRLAQNGKKVTVIEKEYMGGVCLNVGCIPSKALIFAGGMYERMSHLSEMGLKVKGIDVDFPKLIEWKGGVVKKLTDGVGGLLKANGCKVIKGTAEFVNRNELKVTSSKGEQVLQFEDCVIATGSRPAGVPGYTVDQKTVLDSTGALALDAIPKTMLCVGGGYIGLELGMFYAKMGTKVTVAEATDQLLGMVDPELTRVVEKRMRKLGIEVRKGVLAKASGQKKDGFEVEFAPTSGSGKSERAKFEKVLLTVGRVPNTDVIGLENTGLRSDSKGFIEVDDQRRTRVGNIYAIGDVAGQPMLAHKGSKEGLVAADAIAGKRTVYDPVSIPAVVFTDPEVATVGLSEQECKDRGLEIMVGKFPFAANGRALSVAEPDGMVKMIGDKKTGRLLGVHIVGAEASNLIAEATLALEMGATVEDLALTVHAHPTLPETLMEAAEATLGHAVHIFQKPAAPKKSPAPEARA